MECEINVIRDPELDAIGDLLRLATGCQCGCHPVVDTCAWYRAARAMRGSKFVVERIDDMILPDAVPPHFASAWLAGCALGIITPNDDIDPKWVLLCVMNSDAKDAVVFESFHQESWATPEGLSSVYTMYWIPKILYGIASALGKLEEQNLPAPDTDPALLVSQSIMPFLVPAASLR